MKLRRALDSKLGPKAGSAAAKAATTHKAPAQAAFADNEVERQRRLLSQENMTLKKKLRATETILQSGMQERAKFMEGASWLAKKAQIEGERHADKLVSVINEFDRRTKESVKDERIMDFDGQKVAGNKEWI